MRRGKMFQEMSLNLQKLGMKRRKREVRNMKVMAMLSVVFLSMTLLFSENMKSYQQEMNFHAYGEWIFCQPDGREEISHPYLKKAGTIFCGGRIYRAAGGEEKENIEVPAELEFEQDTGTILGTMDKKTAEMGNIALYEGRMPQKEDEIAMELNALQALGYDYELGQTISFYLAEEENWTEKKLNDEKMPLYRVDFTLVGTIKSYTARWVCGQNLPGVIVSREAYQKFTMPKKSYTFLQIKKEYQEVDAESLQEGVLAELDNKFQEGNTDVTSEEAEYYYNSFAYENLFWENKTIYQNILILFMVSGAAALAYLMSSYLSRRRAFYYKLRSIGATAWQIRGMAFYECMYGTVLPSVAALVFSYLFSIVLVWIVAKTAQIPFFYVFRIKTLGMIAGCVLLVLLVSMGVAVSMLGAKRIEEKRKAVSPGRLRRLGKRAAKRKRLIGSRELLCRERMQHPLSILFRRLLGILVCTVIFCCAAQIYAAVRNYGYTVMSLSDYAVSVPGTHFSYNVEDIETDVDDGRTNGGTMGILSMNAVFPESFLRTLEEQSGIKEIQYITHDSTHIFDWKDKEKSKLWKTELKSHVTGNLKDEKKGLATIEERVYPDVYRSNFYKDFSPVWKHLKRHLNTRIADYDRLCRGEQAILLTEMGEEERDVSGGGSDIETTIKEGDILQICTKGRKVSVEVAGVLASDVLSNGISGAYQLMGSEALGRKVAKEDGIEYGYNIAYIDLNRLAAGEATGKVITRLCSIEHMEYDSSMETIAFVSNQVIQRLLMYGMLAGVILVMYLFISFCIRQEEARKQRQKRQQLHWLGMSFSKLHRMGWKEGVLEGSFFWLSVPAFVVVWAIKCWNEYTSEYGQYSTVLGKDVWIFNVYQAVYYDLIDALPFWFPILFMAGITIFMMILHRKELR